MWEKICKLNERWNEKNYKMAAEITGEVERKKHRD